MRRWVSCVLALLTVACSAELAPVDAPGAAQRSRRPTVVANRTPKKRPTRSGSLALIYFQKNEIRAFDLSDGNQRTVGPVPGPDVFLSPNGTKLAVVTDLDPGGDPEGFSEPELGVMALGASQITDLGPGMSPWWSPDSSRIAANTDEGVVVYDVMDGAATDAFPEGWAAYGWSSEQVVAVGSDDVAVAPMGGEPTALDAERSEFWGMSPATPRVLTVAGASATIEGPHGEEPVRFELGGGLGDGAWSPDGRYVAAVLLARNTSLVLIRDDGSVSEVPEGRRAQGGVVWAPDSDRFAFVRVDPADPLKLQAVVCTVDGSCEPAFSWGQGVTLLGFAEV